MTRFTYMRDPLFLAACAGYAVNRSWLKHAWPGWFVHSCLNDLLLIPAALPLVLWAQRRVGLRTHDHPPDWQEMAFHVVVWSFIAEVVGPRWLKHGTADPGDLVAYLVGGVFACLWWRRHGGKPSLTQHHGL